MKTLVVALGGNALLQRGEALTAENQYRNCLAGNYSGGSNDVTFPHLKVE